MMGAEEGRGEERSEEKEEKKKKEKKQCPYVKYTLIKSNGNHIHIHNH